MKKKHENIRELTVKLYVFKTFYFSSPCFLIVIGKLNCPQFVFIIELCLLFACNYCYHAYPKWSLFIIVLQLSEREIFFLKRKGRMYLVLLLKEQVPIFGQMKSPFTNVYCVFASFIYSVGNHIPHSSGVATWHLYDDRDICISLSSHTLAQICFKRLPLTTFFISIHSFIQQIYTENLLCAKHYYKYLGYNSNWNSKISILTGFGG